MCELPCCGVLEIVRIIIIRWNSSCSASDSAYSYTCLHSMVCLICRICALCLNCSVYLDAVWQIYLWCLMTHCIRWGSMTPRGKVISVLNPQPVCVCLSACVCLCLSVLQRHSFPMEHEFSYEQQGILQLFIVYTVAYSLLLPVQIYAVTIQRHNLPVLLTCCLGTVHVLIVCQHAFAACFTNIRTSHFFLQ